MSSKRKKHETRHSFAAEVTFQSHPDGNRHRVSVVMAPGESDLGNAGFSFIGPESESPSYAYVTGCAWACGVLSTFPAIVAVVAMRTEFRSHFRKVSGADLEALDRYMLDGIAEIDPELARQIGETFANGITVGGSHFAHVETRGNREQH